MTEHTLFDCASLSKSFTAAAISLLVDDNNKHPGVDWATPVSSLLREDFVLPDANATEQVTIADILCHRTGMPRHDLSYLCPTAKEPDTPRSTTRNLRNLPMTQPVRTMFQYNNMLYTTASYLVQKLEGVSFEDFLRQRIWNPLHMDGTYLGADRAQAADAGGRLAHGYIWDEDKVAYRDTPWFMQPDGQGAGTIFSSVSDYAKWIQMMIDRNGPVSEEGHKELVRPRMVMGGEGKPSHSPSLYGLAWELHTYMGSQIVGHDGSVSGFGSLMRYLPEKKWGIVIFGNSDGANRVAEIIAWHLVDELLDVPAEQRFDWHAEFEKEEREYRAERDRDPFPERKEPPLPMSLPLEQHTGTFHNAGYKNFVVEVKDGRLFVDATDRSFGFLVTFDHVSAEYFVANVEDEVDHHETFKAKAEFKVDASGVVNQLGIALEEDEANLMIWFTRKQE